MTAASPILPAESPLGGAMPAAGPIAGPRNGPISQAVQRLVLTGFMGSGKSTAGRLLAKRLGWQFADLDTCIEARLGLSVPQIFTLHGEQAFRAAEVHDLAHLLSGSRRVIALGGGAPETPAVRALLADSAGTAVVHLDAPFSVLYERCQKQAMEARSVDRPLLSDVQTAARRYRDRLDIYAAVAHHTAAADAGSPEIVAEAILQLLKL